MTTAQAAPATTQDGCGCPDFRRSSGLTRRRLLQGAVASGLGLAAVNTFGDAFRQVAYGAAPGSNVVVVLSLRGGCDGLSMVVPRGADHDLLESTWRPSTVVPEASLLGSDPRFGLHPAFAPLLPMWNAGRFGAVHATGLPAPNRSHFDSMTAVEEADPGSRQRLGWINRSVGLDASNGPQGAVQLGSAILPTSLVGPAPALGANSVSDLAIPSINNTSDDVRRASLSKIWAGESGLVGDTVRAALATTETLSPLVAAARQDDSAVHAAAYPDGPLRAVLSNTAALIRADVGTTMVTVDYGSWDMHAGMVDGDKDPSRGWMHDMVTHLAGSLQAFFSDLGSAAGRVTVVTLSEFGRRVGENGDRGLDHGYANAMLMLGAGVRGGQVHGRWPGLTANALEDGDLALGQDYRSVLWEVLASRFPTMTGQRATIFPASAPMPSARCAEPSPDREANIEVHSVGRAHYSVLVSIDTNPPPASSGKSGSTAPAGSGDQLDRDVLVVAGVVVLGAIMSILDITVVSVALRTFQNIFDASAAQVAWTMTGYTLALASVIPLTGWAADRFGTKRLYLTAVTLFTLGSVLCATAPSLELLVTFRVLQGLGGGMLMPLGMTILTRAAGPERVGRVMAVLGVPMLLGPIFGPILGGWLITTASWHWIFLINAPIGILAFVYASRVLPRDNVEPSQSFDFVGMLLLSPGLALFLFGVSSIPEQGTVFSFRVLSTALIGLALIAAFVPWALRRANVHPLIDLRLFVNRNFTVAVVAMALFAMAFFGASLLFPLYFQQVRGETALSAGLLLAPQGLGAMITMPIAGILADKIGPGKIVLVGITVITIGLAMFTQLDAGTSYAFMLGALFVMGLGMGATMMPIMSAALATLTQETTARGSTMLNITQQVAASAGTALFSVLLTNGFNASPSIVEAGALASAQSSGNQSRFASLLRQFGISSDQVKPLFAAAQSAMADSFAQVFVVATILVALCLVPALLLPRRKQAPVESSTLVSH